MISVPSRDHLILLGSIISGGRVHDLGRVGAEFGVDPATVQRISRPAPQSFST